MRSHPKTMQQRIADHGKRTVHQRVITRVYYLDRLWKITTLVLHTLNGSIYADNTNRYIKHYERRDTIGGDWKYIRGIRIEEYAA